MRPRLRRGLLGGTTAFAIAASALVSSGAAHAKAPAFVPNVNVPSAVDAGVTPAAIAVLQTYQTSYQTVRTELGAAARPMAVSLVNVPAAGIRFPDGLWGGSYTNAARSIRGFCIDIDKATPAGTYRVHTGTIARFASNANSDTAKYIVNRWGGTNDKRVANAVYITTQDLEGLAKWRAKRPGYIKFLTAKYPGVLTYRNYMLAQAANRGYRATLAVTKKTTTPLQYGSAKLSVFARNGKGAAGGSVTLTAANAVVTSKGRTTNAAGVLPITIRQNHIGTVGLYAATRFHSSTTAAVVDGSSAHQRLLVHTGYTAVVTAKTSYATGSRGKAIQVCPPNCDGYSPVKVTPPCNPKGSPNMLVIANDQTGRRVGTLVQGPGVCKTFTTSRVADNSDVIVSHCFLVGKVCGYGGWIQDTKIRVKCPAHPSVELTVKCACKGLRPGWGTFYYPTGPTGSAPYHKAILLVNNKIVKTAWIPKGGSIKLLAGAVPNGARMVGKFAAYSDAAGKHLGRSGVIDWIDVHRTPAP